MLPFSASGSAAFTAEVDAVSRRHNFGSSVPFGLPQSNNATTLCNTGSQQGVNVADTLTAVNRCCANVERAECELVQPRPRPGGLVFHAGSLPHRPRPPSFFRANTLRYSLSSRCLPMFLPSLLRRVGCTTPNTPRLLHRRHFCLLACDLGAFLLSSLRVPRFPQRWCMVAAGNDSALLGCISTSRCFWQACTVRIDEPSHQSTSCRDIDSCENSIASTPSNCCFVAYPAGSPRLSDHLYVVEYVQLYNIGETLTVNA